MIYTDSIKMKPLQESGMKSKKQKVKGNARYPTRKNSLPAKSLRSDLSSINLTTKHLDANDVVTLPGSRNYQHSKICFR